MPDDPTTEAEAAQASRAKLTSRAEHAGAGIPLGRSRPDITSATPLLCIPERPFAVIADAGTRAVLRILDGGRDFGALHLPASQP